MAAATSATPNRKVQRYGAVLVLHLPKAAAGPRREPEPRAGSAVVNLSANSGGPPLADKADIRLSERLDTSAVQHASIGCVKTYTSHVLKDFGLINVQKITRCETSTNGT
jgi:hypothetical protein